MSSMSSYRNPSLASSTGYSAAASSMTSVDGPISPTSDLESPYENIVSPHARASVSGLPLQARGFQRSAEAKVPTPTRKLSGVQSLPPAKQRMQKTGTGQVYICECCSKKHKKFDNLEDL
ncbi:hypothetical protein KEM55_009228, partial [Ascosphaera atra]